MINPARQRQARRAVLEALSMAGHYAVEESVLLSYINDLVRPPLSALEQTTAMTALKGAEYMRLVPDSLDPDLKQWVLTELGRNFLASL